jgi:phospholipase/lecithinase/hemolysin
MGWDQLIQRIALENSNTVRRLYNKGARTIIIESGFDVSKTPAALDVFGMDINRRQLLSERIAAFNTAFSEMIQSYTKTTPDLRIVEVDMFSTLNSIIAAPASFGFTEAAAGALDDPGLSDKSFGGPGKDYVFWDSLHVTSKMHQLLAAWTLEAMRNVVLEKLQFSLSDGSLRIEMEYLQIGRDYTLQKSRNLKNWQDMISFTASAGTNNWLNPAVDSAAYFRLEWNPGF